MDENSNLNSLKRYFKIEQKKLGIALTASGSFNPIKQVKSSDSEDENSLYKAELIETSHVEKLPKIRITKLRKVRKMDKILELFECDKITKNIQPFDGSRVDLVRFIESVEHILKICKELSDDDEHKKIILLNIRNKIIGKASHSLVTNNVSSNNWNEIKTHLTKKFADTRDESNLQMELFQQIRINQPPQKLYENIVHILTLLTSQVKLNKSDCDIIDHQIKHYQNLGLTIFQSALQDPLGSRVRASNPKTLEEAMDIVTKEENIKKLKEINSPQYKTPQNNQKFRKFNSQKPEVKIDNEKPSTSTSTPSSTSVKKKWIDYRNIKKENSGSSNGSNAPNKTEVHSIQSNISDQDFS